MFDTLIEGYELKSKKEEKNEDNKEPVSEQPTTETKENVGEEHRKKGCNTEEILAVLAHELGHWKLNHNLKNIVLSEVNQFLL